MTYGTVQFGSAGLTSSKRDGNKRLYIYSIEYREHSKQSGVIGKGKIHLLDYMPISSLDTYQVALRAPAVLEM